jgi:hypothetical protein
MSKANRGAIVRLTGALVLCLWAGAALAAGPLLFYGVPLQTATRATVNQALGRAGLPVKAKGPEDWFDTYRMGGLLPALQGASMLSVRFTKHDRFAIAQYTFASYRNVREVQDIIGMVTFKYGKPTSVVGNLQQGPVVARWM